MTIKNIKGVRTLYQQNNSVQSVTIEEALFDFLTFIAKVKSSDEHNNQLTVLMFLFSFEIVTKTSRIALLTWTSTLRIVYIW